MSEESRKFDETVRKVLSVSREELKRREKIWNEARKGKSNDRRNKNNNSTK